MNSTVWLLSSTKKKILSAYLLGETGMRSQWAGMKHNKPPGQGNVERAIYGLKVSVQLGAILSGWEP